MLKKYRTIIVDDEPANIKLLTIFLQKYCPSIEIVGTANNSEKFIELLLIKNPEILLLDIDLGEEKNTLDLLKYFDSSNYEIVITTSHSDFAIDAINQHQISSYILKPIQPIELTKAIKIAENNILFNNISKHKSVAEGAENIIGLPTATNIDIVKIENILYLEADGKYTVFNMVDGSSIIVSRNIGTYRTKLPENLFFRIHSKYIVNIKKIRNISKSDGNYCQLTNGKSLPIAKRRREELCKFLHLK